MGIRRPMSHKEVKELWNTDERCNKLELFSRLKTAPYLIKLLERHLGINNKVLAKKKKNRQYFGEYFSGDPCVSIAIMSHLPTRP